MKVKTQYNAKEFPNYYEENRQPSMTIPDQTLSLHELLVRHARGLPVSGNDMEPLYHGEEELPDLKKMDLSEIHDLKTAVKNDISEKQELLAQHQETARKKKHDDDLEAEVQKRIKSKQKQDSDEKPDPKPKS